MTGYLIVLHALAVLGLILGAHALWKHLPGGCQRWRAKRRTLLEQRKVQRSVAENEQKRMLEPDYGYESAAIWPLPNKTKT